MLPLKKRFLFSIIRQHNNAPASTKWFFSSKKKRETSWKRVLFMTSWSRLATTLTKNWKLSKRMSGTWEGKVSSQFFLQNWLIPKQHGVAIFRNYKTSMKITSLPFRDLRYSTFFIRLELLKSSSKIFWRNFFRKHWKKKNISNPFEVSTIWWDTNIALH